MYVKICNRLRSDKEFKMIAAAHHRNDDLWALGVCFIIGAIALSGAMLLIHQPAMQVLIEDMAGFASQQVQGAFPHPMPMR